LRRERGAREEAALRSSVTMKEVARISFAAELEWRDLGLGRLPCRSALVCLGVLIAACDSGPTPARTEAPPMPGPPRGGAEAPASAAPNVLSLLERPLRDPAVAAVIGADWERCSVTQGRFACPSLGIDLRFDSEDTIYGIDFYPNALGGHYRSYPGQLPYGLVAGDRREDVHRKLGTPDVSIAESDLYSSRSPRIDVVYHSGASANAGLIRYLKISRPR
jgi:hypothetical protein